MSDTTLRDCLCCAYETDCINGLCEGCFHHNRKEYELGYNKGIKEETDRRWKLNERLCEFLGIDKERQLDDGLVDEVIEKLKKIGQGECVGVSQWKADGERYGYWSYFRKQVLKEAMKVIDLGCNEDINCVHTCGKRLKAQQRLLNQFLS